jgi:hypothetical protein
MAPAKITRRRWIGVVIAASLHAATLAASTLAIVESP